jgi:hypothetical protein
MENNKVQEIYNRLTTEQAFAEALKKFEEGKEITTPEESAAAFIEFAKLQGYDVTIDELKAFAENQSKALSEEELDSVNAAGIFAALLTTAIVCDKPVGICLGVGVGWGFAEGAGRTECKVVGLGSGVTWKEGDRKAYEEESKKALEALKKVKFMH